MKTMQDWFDAYGVSHKDHTNKTIHWICVPLIFYSILGILALVPFDFAKGWFPEGVQPFVHLGTLLILSSIVFFFRLSTSIAIGMLGIAFLMLWLVAQTFVVFGDQAWLFFVSVFVLSWIGQFIGHKIEGEKPSFFDDLKFLLIGPAWLLHFIYRKVGISY